MLEQTKKADVGRMSPITINRFAFGIRYEPQYGLLDRVGSVIDMVLRAADTPFGPETFPLSQAKPNEHALLNLEADKALRITQQDSVLMWRSETRHLNLIQGVGSDFDRFVLKPMRQVGQLRNIVRYGVLFHLDDIDQSLLRNRPVNHYLSSEFPNANSLIMRFSQRLPSLEALVKKRIDDYRNVIYSVMETEERKVNISIDYQEYFRPALDASEWSEKPFQAFVGRGLAYFEGEFQRWFEKLVGLSEVA